ncbi:MAG: transposase [Lentisphaerae bacterium]|nr:transposase [Lentisphaerota bacterium]
MRYTGHNLIPAHDLHFSWAGWPSVGALPAEPPNAFFLDLAEAWRADGLTLESRAWTPRSVQLTFAASPDVTPVLLSARAKGRLQHALRRRERDHDTLASGTQKGDPRVLVARVNEVDCERRGVGEAAPGGALFSRKVSVRSLGHNITSTVERYVREQQVRADLADPRYRDMLARQSFHDGDVELAEASETRSGRYWYNLHLVLVVAGRWRMGAEALLARVRETAQATAAGEGCRLKALAIMPDHLHLALRGPVERSPAELALTFQNGTAQAAGCRLWDDRYYVGTFGEYNLNAVT